MTLVSESQAGGYYLSGNC